MATSEKETRPLSFIKNTSAVLATKVILVLLKLAIGILTARILGPNGKGIFVLAIQMPGLLATLSNLSLGEAFVYHILRNRQKAYGYMLQVAQERWANDII